ncbi:peptide ABC transporter substrate-binding protein [Halomonas almeriensis]|uniref:peptide ABC transporter substrate-binding protein n=1 Tax=Halomonas almeriensis TaxID=308163 RepID=UPI0025B3C1A8|nr:peptide ABC transporter substrate-binding protein [Halomonas almeriensis]MDN3553920.1 peptide ABC transporter substrate-binding protein [Halomonas almeriensis]
MHQRTSLMSGIALASALMASPVAAQTLDIGISGDPSSLDPSRITGGVWEEDVLRDIFEGLIAVNAQGEMIPGAASDWTVSEDGKRWTFTLRDELRWSDGEPLTAEDFVFALRRQVNPATASNYAHRLYPVVNAQAVNAGDKPLDALGVESRDDGRTLVIHLEEPAAYFLKTLILPFGYPLPEHAVEEHGDAWSKPENIVVNGAFKPVSRVANTRLETARNPAYHAADSVSLEGVNFFPVEDKNAGISRFRAGELDILRDFPAARYQWLEDNLPEATRITPSLGSYYYAFNLAENSPVADRRIREALSLAIRREVIANQLLDGAVTPAHSLVPTGVNHYTPAVQPGLDEDMETRMARARELMQEAGHGPDNPLELTLRYNSSEEHQRIAVAVAAMWEPLGVEVEMRASEANVHYSELMEADFQVARAAWISSYDDAQNFLQLLSSEGTNNYGNYANPEFDRLLGEADRESDDDARRDMMERAEAMALADYPLAPIYLYSARNLVDPALNGWENNALDMHPSRYVSLDETN